MLIKFGFFLFAFAGLKIMDFDFWSSKKKNKVEKSSHAEKIVFFAKYGLPAGVNVIFPIFPACHIGNASRRPPGFLL